MTATEKILKTAEECGFTAAFPLAPAKLAFMPEVRDMCASGRCGQYNKSWSCPPACGELSEIAEKAADYSCGVLLQTTAKLDDSFDYETMRKAEISHRESFNRLIAVMRREYTDMLPMGAGSCRICSECAYPTAPCRLPDKMTVSMEAYGLLVSDVCRSCGAPYYYGAGTMTYNACILYNEREFKSKQNHVFPLDFGGRAAVKKKFTSPGRMETELRVMDTLRRAGIRVPDEYEHGGDYVIYERIGGETLLSMLESGSFTDKLAKQLALWLSGCRKALRDAFGEPYVLGDIHLANFIWDGKEICGFDFEECRSGEFEDDAGMLLAFIPMYKPEFSDYEMKVTGVFADCLCRYADADRDKMRTAAEKTFSLLFSRRGIEYDGENVRRALDLI